VTASDVGTRPVQPLRGEREQPFWDLTSLVQRVASPVVVDFGCGDGRLTSLLGETLGAASITGIDSSPSMIGAAMRYSSDRTSFVLGIWRRGRSRTGLMWSSRTPRFSGSRTTRVCWQGGQAA